MLQIENIQDICETCMLRKQQRHQAPKEFDNTTNNVNDLVHADLIGPMKIKFLSGYRYVVVFTDDMNRKSFVYFKRSKDEALAKFKLCVARTEIKIGRKVKKLCTDRGGEFLLEEFTKFCNSHGIQRQLIQAKPPHQNGVAERRNKSLIEKARNFLFESKLLMFLKT